MELETVIEGTNPDVAVYTPPRTTAISPCRGWQNDFNSPPHFDRTLALRMEKDKCFSCGNQGHWAKYCPTKTPKKASTPEEDIRFLPVMRCYCGVAYAINDCSRGKNYYRRCNCTDVVPNNPNQRVFWCSETKAPMCKCGAGPCTINMSKDGNGDPFIYYTCRIRTGHGSCGFLHFVAAPSSPSFTTVRRGVEKDRQPSVLTSKRNGTPNTITHEGECSDFSNRNVDTLDMETCDPVRGNQPRVSHLMSRSDIHLRQIEFWNQICDADDSGNESEVQNLSHHVDGWMGRLAFPPSRYLADPPPKHFFSCMFHPMLISAFVDGCNTRSSRILSDASSSAKVDEILLNAGSSVNQLLSSRTSSLKRSFMQGEVTSLIVKKVDENKLQKGLLIESLDYPDQEIQLTSIVQDNYNTQAPAKHDNNEKYIDDITSFGAKALTSLTASKNNLLSARQRMSHFKDKLLQIEQQLNRCQTETWKLETLLQDIFKDVGPSNKRMQAAYQALTEEDCMPRTTPEEICSSPSEIYKLDLRKRQKIVDDDYGQ